MSINHSNKKDFDNSDVQSSLRTSGLGAWQGDEVLLSGRTIRRQLLHQPGERGERDRREDKVVHFLSFSKSRESPPTQCGGPRLAPAARGGVRLVSRPGGLGGVR